MIILAILAAMNGEPDAAKDPSANAPAARVEQSAPAPDRRCRDVLGRMVTCNPQ